MSVLDYAKPFNIMVGYWAGVANIYGPEGVYAMSTKSHVAVYWRNNPRGSEEEYELLHFRESAEDFQEREISEAWDPALVAFVGVLPLEYDLYVTNRYCRFESNALELTGRATSPDVYQFHIKKNQNGHQFYNSHHFPNPNEWHIMGSIAGTDGKIGVAVVQTFRRIYYEARAEHRRTLRLA